MKFKIGDVCEVVAVQYYPELLGAIITITGPARLCENLTRGDAWWGYPTSLQEDDRYAHIFPGGENLRKLPPKQGTTTWEDIQQITGWVPNKQGVES